MYCNVREITKNKKNKKNKKKIKECRARHQYLYLEILYSLAPEAVNPEISRYLLLKSPLQSSYIQYCLHQSLSSIQIQILIRI